MLVEEETASYGMHIVISLVTFKAEIEDNNRTLYQDVPPDILAQLIKLRHGRFVQNFMELFCTHVPQTLAPETFDNI